MDKWSAIGVASTAASNAVQAETLEKGDSAEAAMPDGMMQPPGTPPAAAGGASPAMPPPGGQATGPNPASTPVPNRGLEAAAMARLAVYVQGMSTMLAVLPAGSEIARDVREAINKVAKHVPPGSVSEGVKMTEAQRNLMQQRQNMPQIAAMRAAQAGGGAAQPSPSPAQPMAA